MYKIWSKNICTFLRYHDYHIGTVYYAHSCTSVVTSYTHFVCISAKCDFFSYLIVLCTVISLCIGLFVSSIVCCVTFAESEPYCHSILFVCLLVIPQPTAYHDWSITTRFGRQVYTCPWTCVSLFWIPYFPYFRCQRENVQNFAYFQANVTHRAIWLVCICCYTHYGTRRAKLVAL